MSEETGAPAGGEAFHSVELPADAPESFNSPSEAAAYFTSLLEKPEKEQPVERAEAATAENELPDEGNPESPETETTAEDNEAEPAKPAIDPPKSWTKDLHDHWASLDPVLQERIVARDREDQAAIKRAFNEAADERRAVKVEREAAEEARQQYEAKTKAALEVLEREQLRDFPDIKTMADVAKMALEDPFRKIQWDVHQDQIRAAAWEKQQADQRKSQEHQTQWTEHVQKENALAAEYIPELADKTKGPALTARAADRLSELGFKPEELARLASGQEKLSLYDHRIQRLIFSDLKLSDIQSAPKAVVKPSLPPVQRPGTSKPAGAVQSERVQALNRKSELTVKEATELYELEHRSTRRAS